MVGLDSLYAMLARPARATIKRKRLVVEETESGSGISADKHDEEQSTLNSAQERRRTREDRRAGDRRDTSQRDKNRETHEAINSPLPRIDIDI